MLIRGTRTLVSVSYPAVTWVWIFILAILSTLVGYSLYTKGLRYLEAGRAGIAATWEVVVASVLAFVIFGETLTYLQILGAALVLFAPPLVLLGGNCGGTGSSAGGKVGANVLDRKERKVQILCQRSGSEGSGALS